MSGAFGPGRKSADGRRGPRTPVDLEAVVGGRAPRPGRVVDLSLIGCLIRTEAALASGAVLDLTLALPDGAWRGKGRVRDSSLDGEAQAGSPSFLSGLEFLAVSAADESRLRGFLEAEARRRRGADTPPA